MINYFAAAEPHNLTRIESILLSYWDIGPGTIPFRKVTWDILKGENNAKNKDDGSDQKREKGK